MTKQMARRTGCVLLIPVETAQQEPTVERAVDINREHAKEH